MRATFQLECVAVKKRTFSAAVGPALTFFLLLFAQPAFAAVVVVVDPNAGGTVTFDWATTPSTQSDSFTMSTPFRLSLISYDDTSASATDVTGFTLDLSGTGRLTDDTSFCLGADAPVSGTCDLVSHSGYTGAEPAGLPGTSLLAGAVLSPGTYTLGLFDSATPPSGNVVSASPPCPCPRVSGSF